MPPSPILDRAHLRPGDRICAAVSGGADSVALLLLLQEANGLPKNGLGVGLSAIHVHHGLRSHDADADAEFVRELCARLSVPLRIYRVSVPDRLAACRGAGRPETTEEAARELRHDCFRSLAAEGATDSILTAHTLDDQAETVLMKLLRGAWTEGLGGIYPSVRLHASQPMPASAQITPASAPLMPASTPLHLVRPLLAVRRAALRDFLTARAQPWREDATNANLDFTRNRIRHHILPLLRPENPSLEDTLAHLATLAREDEVHWTAEVTRILPSLVLPGRPTRGGGRSVPTTGPAPIAIDLERLRALTPALRRRVVRASARQLGSRIAFEDTERLLALAGLSGNFSPRTRPGARLDLPGGLKAERSARELRLFLPERAPQPPED